MSDDDYRSPEQRFQDAQRAEERRREWDQLHEVDADVLRYREEKEQRKARPIMLEAKAIMLEAKAEFARVLETGSGLGKRAGADDKKPCACGCGEMISRRALKLTKADFEKREFLNVAHKHRIKIPMEKTCPECQRVFKQRATEPNSRWRVRKTCASARCLRANKARGGRARWAKQREAKSA